MPWRRTDSPARSSRLALSREEFIGRIRCGARTVGVPFDRRPRGCCFLAVVVDAVDSGGAAMIQPLRRAHFRIWLVLVAVLYAVFIAGLVARRSATPPNQNVYWENHR
jgi:hypothetical protein